MKLTRRKALVAGAAAVVVSPVLANRAHVHGDDADLIIWEREILALEAGFDHVESDAVGEALCDEICKREYRIAKAVAQTPKGLAVKLRRLHVGFQDGTANWDYDNIRTAIESAERMGSAQS